MAGQSNVGSILGKFIQSQIRKGIPATPSLAQFRLPSVGGKVRDSYFFKAYKQIQRAMETHPDTMGLPGHRIPGRESFNDWAAGKEGGHIYAFQVSARQVGTGAIVDHPWSRRYDSPVSINKAMRDAQTEFELGSVSFNYPVKFQSITLTGLYYQTGM